MKTKFSLTTIFFQPTKLIIQMICLLSLLSLAIAIWNYVREEKD